MDHAESFDKLEFDPEDLPVIEQLSVLKQIMADRKNDPSHHGLPTESFILTLQGDRMRLGYHCYEMQLNHHERLREVEKTAEKGLSEVLKFLKKEFKKRTKKALSVKELKESRDHSIQKVSMNERYYFVSWRVYSIELAVR